MRTVAEDVREAFRSLQKHPRFLLIAALTLALGIGAVTAIFSIVNAVLLKPLPYAHADRLVNIWSTAPGLGLDRFPLSPDLFLYYRRHNTVFEDMALSQGRTAILTEGGPPEVVDAAVATSSYFATLGAVFANGRAYTADEDKPGAPKVVVVSHRLWTRRYMADRTLVGRTIRVDGEASEVVGIAPALMDQRNSPDLWLPARFDKADLPSGNFGWSAIGRLKSGVRRDGAETDLEALVGRAMSDYIVSPNYRAFLTEGRYRPLVRDLKEDVVGSVREPLLILLGTVAIVLLIACGNVANLCLVRAEARQRELAVRAALGGSRAGLLRMLMIESMMLSVTGAILGVLFAAMALKLVLQLAPATMPRLDQVRIDTTVLVFAAATAIVSALVFGLIPAIRYTGPRMLTSLRHGGRGSTDGPARQRGRQLLVVAQTAMALVLLVGSGLLARSFARLMNAEQGFVSEGVTTFRVALPQAAYPKPIDVVRFTERLVQQLSNLPGVEEAGAATAVPLDSTGSGTAFEFAGHPVEAGRLPPIVNYSTTSLGYFKTLRIPLRRGEDFHSGDLREDVRTVIVNEAAAERFWPGEDPIGKRLRMASSSEPATRPWFTVKGVVGNVRQESLREPPVPHIYLPLNVRNDGEPRAFNYVIRGERLEAQAEAIRRTVWGINPDLPVASLRTMNDVVQQSIVQFTFTMLTLGIAAGVAILLGAVGLYGVLSYAVSLRTREIGVRIALGAPPSRVQRAVIGNAAVIMGVGLVIGALGAAGLTQFLGQMLYETNRFDFVTFAGTSALLFLVGVAAAYLPARRASTVSPMEAMRAE